MRRRIYGEEIELMLGITIPSFDECHGKGRDGITQKQRDFIHSLGINVTGIKYKAQASAVIDCAIQRKKDGMASLKQIQTIRNLKIKTKKPICNLTKDEASVILTKYLSY